MGLAAVYWFSGFRRIAVSESKNARDILKWIGTTATTLFRNNVGIGWVGQRVTRIVTRPQTITVYPGDVIVHDARPLHAGLCKGSGDYIGWTEVLITPDMVGTLIAQFTALETKHTRSSRKSEPQRHFIETVLRAGGKAGFATTIDETKEILRV
jgi:hypothetical protein